MKTAPLLSDIPEVAERLRVRCEITKLLSEIFPVAEAVTVIGPDVVAKNVAMQPDQDVEIASVREVSASSLDEAMR